MILLQTIGIELTALHVLTGALGVGLGFGLQVIVNNLVSGAIIVPNLNFITEAVVNWSHNDPKVRFRIPISAAYGSDVRKVEQALLEAARENAQVLAEPPPAVTFSNATVESRVRQPDT